MRWSLPWRSRPAAAPATDPGTTPATGTGATAATGTASAGSAPARPQRPAWRSLAPIPTTVALRAPILAPATLPDVAGTRPLTGANPRAAAGRVPDDQVPHGRVRGLATPVPPDPPAPPATALAADVVVPTAGAGTGPAAEPPRRNPRVVAGPPQPAPELVRAVDAYVGPAREPAVPYRAPGWLRAAPPPLPVAGIPPELAAMPVRPAPGSAPRPGGPADPVRPGYPAGPARTDGHPRPDARDGHPRPDARDGLPRPDGRRSVGQSRRLGLGAPISRPAAAEAAGAPPDGPPPGGPTGRGDPTAADRTEPVPPDLAAQVRAAYGTDVGAVPVHRGPTADSGAERLAARAYTADAEVYLPLAAGEATGPQGRALLAHELVHAVQQRDLGGSLPAESSPEGARLEADALAAEDAGLEILSRPALHHRVPPDDP
ncbi:eCIS core domain-containing protein, partial [Planosporangium sp. 12N6]|uniref:eCIS core domain-containing protein n=1 Tax=Planosporangium spinosum TaxID=3402278 RepID=UPI003CFA3771